MARPRARRGSPLYMTPALELLFHSYPLVKKNLSIFSLLYFFPLVVGLSNGFWVVDLERHLTPDALDAANAVGNPMLPAYSYGRLTLMFIVAITIATVAKIMLHSAELRAAEDKRIKPLPLWRLVKTRWQQFLGLYIVSSAIISVWLIPAYLDRHMWLELICFIPALYFLRKYFLAPYVLLDNPEMNFWQAMSRSSEMTGKDPRSIYSMIGVMLIFALFGIIPFIGWIFAFGLLFFYSAAPAIRYRELKRLT